MTATTVSVIELPNPRFLHSLPNDSTTTNINTSSTEFSLVDYAQEPLLSLNETCQSLIPIIDNILLHAANAMKNTPKPPPDNLTCDESASIRLYTMEWPTHENSLYFILNKILHEQNREALLPWHKYLKLLLTALVKIPCSPDQTIWRGVKLDISKDFTPKKEIIWWRFTSCTTSLRVLQSNIYLGIELVQEHFFP